MKMTDNAVLPETNERKQKTHTRKRKPREKNEMHNKPRVEI